MDNLLFSLIVPVYNSAEYLKECMDSLLAQTIDCYEILLIENGSTDHSPTMCDKYQQQYPCVRTFHIPNGGLSDARNYGVKQASGNYLIFIDSDDFIKSTTLAEFKAVINRHNQVDIITSDGKYLTYKDKMFPATYSIDFKNLDGKNGIEWVTEFLQNGVDDWNGPGKCFSTQFWKINNFEFKFGRLSEDVELIYKVFLKASTVSSIDTFYYYRQARPGSIITKANPKLVKDTILNLVEWDIYLKGCSCLTDVQKQLFYERFSKQYCTSVLGMIYGFDSRMRRELLSESEKAKFYLSKGNSKIVRISHFITSVINIRVTCLILYFARQLSRFLTKVKWLIRGSKLNVN